ncbi:MAG: family 16 glycoside hydrolase [Bryobacteraceae bacterium]
MKFLPFLLLCTGAVYAADSLDVFGMHWTVPLASEWKVDEGALHLVTTRGPDKNKPRRPQQFALSDKEYGSFRLEADVKVLQRSLIIVYAYKDEAHFNYAHLSTDTGVKQPVHNGIFHVFGGERVRISSTEGPPSFAALDEWNHVTLKYDAQAGKMMVLVNGKPNPSVTAVDMSLGPGKIGLGSFDETAVFKNVKIIPAK